MARAERAVRRAAFFGMATPSLRGTARRPARFRRGAVKNVVENLVSKSGSFPPDLLHALEPRRSVVRLHF